MHRANFQLLITSSLVTESIFICFECGGKTGRRTTQTQICNSPTKQQYTIRNTTVESIADYLLHNNGTIELNRMDCGQQEWHALAVMCVWWSWLCACVFHCPFWPSTCTLQPIFLFFPKTKMLTRCATVALSSTILHTWHTQFTLTTATNFIRLVFPV